MLWLLLSLGSSLAAVVSRLSAAGLCTDVDSFVCMCQGDLAGVLAVFVKDADWENRALQGDGGAGGAGGGGHVLH